MAGMNGVNRLKGHEHGKNPAEIHESLGINPKSFAQGSRGFREFRLTRGIPEQWQRKDSLTNATGLIRKHIIVSRQYTYRFPVRKGDFTLVRNGGDAYDRKIPVRPETAQTSRCDIPGAGNRNPDSAVQ